jgi:hypothetical protein
MVNLNTQRVDGMLGYFTLTPSTIPNNMAYLKICSEYQAYHPLGCSLSRFQRTQTNVQCPPQCSFHI